MNNCCRLLINLYFCFKACALSVHLMQDVYATVLWDCQSAADQSCSIYCYDFFYKNVIITSLRKESLTDSVKIKLPSADIFTYRYLLKVSKKNCPRTVRNIWKNKCITFSPNTVYITECDRTCEISLKSWLTIIIPPSKSLIASASASMVSMSRWLVGSSSSRRCGRCHASQAKITRHRCPSDRLRIGHV